MFLRPKHGTSIRGVSVEFGRFTHKEEEFEVSLKVPTEHLDQYELWFRCSIAAVDIPVIGGATYVAALEDLKVAEKKGANKVQYMDFNFDGHPDVMVFESRGGGRGALNETFEVVLYNTETKAYERHDGLSDLCNPWADPATKQVHSTVAGRGLGGVAETYVWQNDTLVLKERITRVQKGESLITTTESMVRGELKVTSKQVEDLSEFTKEEPAGIKEKP